MPHDLRVLQNDFWQVGILPATGAAIAFGRFRRQGEWVDVLRPTAEADYGNASLCASFLMIPWSNRLRDARFRFDGNEYALAVSSSDGTAIHGDVRRRPWRVENAASTALRLSFSSWLHQNVNFPFRFAAQAQYRLEDRDFVMIITLTNEDSQPMPGGFGHHPYFVHRSDTPVLLELPYDRQFELVNSLPSGPSVPLAPRVDFRQRRLLGDTVLDDQLSARHGEQPIRIQYPNWGIELVMSSDPLFQHVVVFAPPGKPFYAVEPVTNCNDGFNLFDQGVPETGVFVLQLGESRSGTVRLRLEGGGDGG